MAPATRTPVTHADTIKFLREHGLHVLADDLERVVLAQPVIKDVAA